MGGIVARSYVAEGGDFTKLVTLSSPHHGSPLANNVMFTLGALLGLNNPGPKDLAPDYDFLKSLNSNSIDIASRSKYYTWGAEMNGHWERKGLKLVWVWDGNYDDPRSGISKIGWLLMSEPNDGLVPINSSQFEGTNIQQPVQNIDHSQYLDPPSTPDVSNYILTL